MEVRHRQQRRRWRWSESSTQTQTHRYGHTWGRLLQKWHLNSTPLLGASGPGHVIHMHLFKGTGALVHGQAPGVVVCCSCFQPRMGMLQAFSITIIATAFKASDWTACVLVPDASSEEKITFSSRKLSIRSTWPTHNSYAFMISDSMSDVLEYRSTSMLGTQSFHDIPVVFQRRRR